MLARALPLLGLGLCLTIGGSRAPSERTVRQVLSEPNGVYVIRGSVLCQDRVQLTVSDGTGDLPVSGRCGWSKGSATVTVVKEGVGYRALKVKEVRANRKTCPIERTERGLGKVMAQTGSCAGLIRLERGGERSRTAVLTDRGWMGE